MQGSACGGDAVTPHGAGAVDEQLECNALAWHRHGRLEGGQRHARRGGRDRVGGQNRQRRAGLARLDQDDNVAVERCAGQQIDLDTAVDRAEGDPVGGTFDGRIGQGASHDDRQRQRILDLNRRLRYLLRLQPGLGGIAVSRRNRGGYRQPQAPLLEHQQLGDPDFENDLVVGFEVADVRCVQSVADGLQHHGSIAVGHAVFIALLCRYLLDHYGVLPFAVEFRRESQQDCPVRQGKRVHDLEHIGGGVAIGLPYNEIEQRTVDSPLGSHARQNRALGVVMPATQREATRLIVHRRCSSDCAVHRLHGCLL